MSLFAAAGAETQTLVNKTIPTGRHRLEVNRERLPAEAYFVRLQLRNRTQTKRVLKMG